jgi:AcrR family transcriptional regulator
VPAPTDAPSSPRRSRARRGDGERLREEILEAAEAILIETNDQSSLSIRAIAARVGVTPPSIYLHFADRLDLLYAVAERHFEQLEAAMNAAADGVADPRERLHRRGEAYLNYGLTHPEHYRLLMMSRPDDTPERFADERLVDTAGLLPVIEDIKAAADAGLIGDRDPFEVAELLWMCMHGTVSLLISKPEFPFGDAPTVFERLFDLVWAGLTATA